MSVLSPPRAAFAELKAPGGNGHPQNPRKIEVQTVLFRFQRDQNLFKGRLSLDEKALSMDVARLLSEGLTQASPGWLALAAELLAGYRPYPLVLRHHTYNQSDPIRADVSVRRWSEEHLLRLGSSPDWVELLLDSEGKLWGCRMQRRRWLRRNNEEQIYDDVHQLERVSTVERWQFERVLNCLIQQKGQLFWQSWAQLDSLQHLRLVGIGQDWNVLGSVLEHNPEVAVEALPLLLSEHAHPACRSALLQAGEQGLYSPPPATLPWLLLQSDWNSNAGVIGLVRASINRNPSAAWRLQQHANPLVRRRLALQLPAAQNWLEWLVRENDEEVRRSLRQRIEAEHDVQWVLAQLTANAEEPIYSCLGWLLANWSKPWNKSLLSPAVLRLLDRRLNARLLRRLRLSR